jgi:cytochrome b
MTEPTFNPDTLMADMESTPPKVSEPAPKKTSTEPRKIKVWDASLRFFHWSLVASIGFLWYSGETGGNVMNWHIYVGYFVLGLIIYRVIWGFIGSRYARFGQFVTGPFATVKYAMQFLIGREKEHLSHNPLGSWMVLVLLTVIFLQAATGLFASDDILVEGPLYSLVPNDIAGMLTEIHEFNFNVILACIAVHIVAVLLHMVFRREHLARSMVTGYKTSKSAEATSIKEPFIRIAITAVLSIAAVYGIVQLGG